MFSLEQFTEMIPASAKNYWLLLKNVRHFMVVISVVSSFHFHAVSMSNHSLLSMLLVVNETKCI